jgi:hypothetical protein
MSGFWDDAELIHSYTRRQAIADGVLVDMEQDELSQLRREAARFKIRQLTTQR